jgi:hypothetical protein
VPLSGEAKARYQRAYMARKRAAQRQQKRKDDMTELKINAPHGEKMLTLTVRFWTNDIAPDGQFAKHAWTAGWVTLDRNEAHGLVGKPIKAVFHTLLDLPRAIQDVLTEAGITLHLSPQMAKYVADAPEAAAAFVEEDA